MLKTIQWLNTGIFPATVMFSCGFTFHEVKAHLKKVKATEWLKAFDDPSVNEMMDSRTWFAKSIVMEFWDKKQGKYTDKKHLYFIIIPDFHRGDNDYVKLAHEVLHICQFFLPDVLDRLKEHEAEAYLHTHLMRQILAALK